MQIQKHRFILLFALAIVLTSSLTYAYAQAQTFHINAYSGTQGYSYVIFQIGSTYYSKNGANGNIDSGTNAYTLFYNAVDSLSATGGIVFVKCGTYNFGSNMLTITYDGLSIIGESRRQTTITSIADYAIYYESVDHWNLEHITINGGLKLYDAHSGICQDVFLTNGKLYSLSMQESWNNAFYQTKCNDAQTYDGAFITDRCNSVKFIGCEFSGNNRFGIFIASSNEDYADYYNQASILFESCIIASNQEAGINIRCWENGYIYDIEITNCYFELNSENTTGFDSHVNIKLGQVGDTYYPINTLIINCWFDGPSQEQEFYHIYAIESKWLTVTDCTNFLENPYVDNFYISESTAYNTTIARIYGYSS